MRSPAPRVLRTLDRCGDALEISDVCTKRNVSAILIAGDQAGAPDLPTPGACAALDLIEHDLQARFAPGGVAIARLAGRPTREQVGQAFAAMTPSIRQDDLFVVMFAGHGMPADGVHQTDAWSLTAGEVFTDRDLALALRAVPLGRDVVVISACCYGAGVFRIAHPDRRRCAHGLGDAAMICISAAGPHDEVELMKLPELARQVVAAAGAGCSYRQLAARFAATAVAGRTFHVEARPARRLAEPVLSASAPARGPRHAV
jgi:hypothetical protein